MSDKPKCRMVIDGVRCTHDAFNRGLCTTHRLWCHKATARLRELHAKYALPAVGCGKGGGRKPKSKPKPDPTDAECEAQADELLAAVDADADLDIGGAATRTQAERARKQLMGTDPAAAQAHREARRRREDYTKLAYSLGHTQLKRDPATGDITFRSAINGLVVTISMDGHVTTEEPVPGRTSALMNLTMDDEEMNDE